MTDQEKYQIIGKVVSDHEKAKKHLVVLFAKGKDLGEGLHAVANVLMNNASGMFDGKAFQIKSRHGGRLIHTVVWPSEDEVRQLIEEIDTTRNDIASLEQQRKELGV